MSLASKKRKSKTKTLNGFLVVMVIVLLSSLPYLHDVITSFKGGLNDWVPIVGLQAWLTDNNGDILGFSSYRMFLYTLLLFVFTGIGWAAWLLVSKKKSYYLALWIPTFMGIYHVLIILFNLRRTAANDVGTKLVLILLLTILLFFIYFFRYRKISFRTVFWWLFIVALSTMPFLHDILMDRSGELRSLVPVLGIENILTDENGIIGGFGMYRVFIYFLMIHIYAHLGWLGAFLYYNSNRKKIRPFLLLPVIISLYSVVVILLNWQESGFNRPNIKFYVSILITILLAINFFFNDKIKQPETLTKNTENV